MGVVTTLVDQVVQTQPLVIAVLVLLGFLLREVVARFLGTAAAAPAKKKQSAKTDTFESCAPDEDNDPEHAPGPSKEEEEAEMVPLSFTRYSPSEMQQRAAEFYELMNKRRTVRHFSSDPIPEGVLESIIHCAGTAPSGAHTQPWQFVVVRDAKYKQQLRALIEEEEEINYRRRMGDQWVEDLSPLQTDWRKPYIETAPASVIVLRSPYSFDEDGNKRIHYYHELSTGIACGLLGNVVLLLPIGYPSEECHVPNLHRKALKDIMTVF
ncbi:hypothetical protein PTSG_08135 [Salpingoeca rosetta]|uniref:Nitroreductase domain-containing protein n=1 Tax=Salpingoeca rosetta (strain ATCC 50818 / BSB-021) TaxID=946362 RepID=F2UI35_SALR5|nr:uncharacterized protein PTSG_08135 [Salpingoeca rosetta]EGD76784.1 hypothetical protein PTSG_08135 [Salpingoeca rosetta]|eukprot:XP_004991156.1 hypothetical protein PTSG_08135 [Salpingoeca rosetta]